MAGAETTVGQATTKFLRSILPSEGHGSYCVGIKPKADAFRNEFFDSIVDARRKLTR